jgi:electron transfer flavoprotein alpha subunit
MRKRRDPRAELQARLTAGTQRRRFALTPASPPPALRPRRDPRVLRMAATIMAGARRRIDWQARRGDAAVSSPRPETAGHQAPAPEIRIIADPAFLVLAVPDHLDGALSDHDRQLLSAARQFADAGGGAVVAVTRGGVEGLGEAGADRAVALPSQALAPYDPEGHAAAILAAMAMLKPRHVLFPESAEGGADLARRVAALSHERLFSGVEGVSSGRVSRRMGGGAREMLGGPPLLMSIAENAFASHDGAAHEARQLDAPEFQAERRIESAVMLPVDAGLVPLSEAAFILSAGNGVTDWGGFAELGGILGATLGGSRVVCDQGHLPRDRQVGASGSHIAARCYLALGISGAPQHLQGITEVRHVVAVNTDLHAEMIKRADLAIIADAQAVMPALIRHARERRNG